MGRGYCDAGQKQSVAALPKATERLCARSGHGASERPRASARTERYDMRIRKNDDANQIPRISGIGLTESVPTNAWRLSVAVGRNW